MLSDGPLMGTPVNYLGNMGTTWCERRYISTMWGLCKVRGLAIPSSGSLTAASIFPAATLHVRKSELSPTHELQSKLLKGSYLGDNIGDYWGYSGLLLRNLN